MYNWSYTAAVNRVNKVLVACVTTEKIANLFNTIIDNRYYLSFSEFTIYNATCEAIKFAIFKNNRGPAKDGYWKRESNRVKTTDEL